MQGAKSNEEKAFKMARPGRFLFMKRTIVGPAKIDHPMQHQHKRFQDECLGNAPLHIPVATIIMYIYKLTKGCVYGHL